MSFIHKKFSNPIEKWGGLIAGLAWGVTYFIMIAVSTRFQIIEKWDIFYPMEAVRATWWTYMIQIFFFSFNYVLGGMMAFSLLFLFFNFFLGVSKLGTEKFPLNVTYISIKSGSFHNIGKTVINVSVPLLLISTGVGIFGLLNMYFLDNNVFFGFMEILFGILISVFILILLYRDTIHVHQSIVEFKGKLVDESIEILEKEMRQEKIDYIRVSSINHFISEVENTSDWPFDPASLRKFFVAFATTFLPFILSFIGIGDTAIGDFIMNLIGA
jgi:hypothetical protein